MNKKIRFPVALLLAVLPAAYLAIVYKQMPETVATHFGINGEPDRFGHKSELWVSTLILAAVSLLAWLLLTNINRFDPKKASENRADVLTKIAWVVTGFICLLSLMIIQSAKAGEILYIRYIFPVVGVMFAVIGNYMPKLKQNYFAGFRTPWALESEYNWKITHQVAGKYFFWGGLLIAAITLILNGVPAIIAFFAISLVMVVVPLIRSWRVFQQEKRKRIQ